MFPIAGEAQKKNLTSFSLDADRVRGPLRPELPSCSENSIPPDTWLEESSSSPWRPGLLRRASKGGACAPGIGRVEFFSFTAMENGDFNLEPFCSLRRRGGGRQLQEEKFSKGKS